MQHNHKKAFCKPGNTVALADRSYTFIECKLYLEVTGMKSRPVNHIYIKEVQCNHKSTKLFGNLATLLRTH